MTILKILLAFLAFCAPAWALPPTPAIPAISQIAGNPSAARTALISNTRYYSPADPQFGGKLNARQFLAACSMTSASQTLTCGSASTITGTLTIAQGQRALTSTTSIFTAAMTGLPIQIPGAGLNGGTLNTTLQFANGTKAYLLDQAQTALSGVSTTVTVGAYFNPATDPGNAIVVGFQGQRNTGIGSGSTPLVTTIQSCASVNTCTLVTPATGSIGGGYKDLVNVMVGADDSAACTATVTAALARGDRYIYVPTPMYAPTCTPEAAQMIFFGEAGYDAGGGLYFFPVRRRVIPPNAGQGRAPMQTVYPALHLQHLKTAATAGGGKVCITGDSLNLFNAALANAPEAQSVPANEFARFGRLTPTTLGSFYERAIGSQTWQAFQAASIGSTDVINWWGTNTTLPWLGADGSGGYLNSIGCDTLVIGFGNNDAFSINPAYVYNALNTIKGWSHQPDILFNISWPQDETEEQDQYDYPEMFMRTFAEVHGFGYFDFDRAAVIARDGYDPVGKALVQVPNITTLTNGGYFTQGFFQFPIGSTGYAMQTIFAETAPTWFASAIAPTTGVGELRFQIGFATDNIVRIGIDNTAQGGGGTGDAYVECDTSHLYIGDGCATKTGVPVIYTAQLTLTMTAGSNSLTSTTAAFTSADEGNPLVIPNVGPTMYNTAFNDYLLCNMHYVSATNVTCFTNSGHGTAANATNALSSAVEAVGRGNPHIVSPYSIASDTTTDAVMGIDNTGDRLLIWYENPTQILYEGPAVKFGAGTDYEATQFTINASVSGVSNWSIGVGAGGPYFYVEQPQMTWPTLTNLDINGVPTAFGDAPAAPASPHMGSANNHPATTASFIRAVVEAQNLCALCN